MSKWKRKEVIIEAEPYSPGMEDGWVKEPAAGGVVTKDGGLLAAYINSCGERVLIPRDAYIQTCDNGIRFVHGKEFFEMNYEPL